jgi:hypothetical protein
MIHLVLLWCLFTNYYLLIAYLADICLLGTGGIIMGRVQGKCKTNITNWSERSECAALGCWHKRRWPLFLVIFPFLLTTAIQNHRRGCRRVSNFCMGPWGRFLGFFRCFFENFSRRSVRVLKLQREFILTKKGDINPQTNSETPPPGSQVLKKK